MDPRAITLAQLEFKEFNDQVRVRSRRRFTSGRQRPVTIPSLLTQTLVRRVASIRPWMVSARLPWLGRLRGLSI